jgi:pimeloyl-ACP methyl ester carboxylesterase
MGMTVTSTTVFRRRVFYLPGYDPFHPRRYRELYRREAAAQAAISGYDIALTPKQVKGPYGWRVVGDMDGARAETDVEVLVWSDLVRTSMTTGIAGTYLQLLRTAWAYIGSGALFRLARLRKGPMIAALYPIVFLLCQLGVAVTAGWGIGALVASFSHWAAGVVAGFAIVWVILRLFRRWDHKVYAYYLMHDYAYSAQFGGANPPELEVRMAAHMQTIRAALDGDFDEVLVVGHSSGAHLAVSILADMLRAGVSAGGPVLSLLTLGQVVPMVSFLPKAGKLRRDLQYLSVQKALTWVDVTAPGDGCAFALCDPVSVTGVATEGKRWPLVISAAFTQTLSPERWKALRWRFFKLHFQYLCAFDRPGDYDYFRITGGAQTLADRYRGRAPSKSRIETPLSGYRSLS